MSMRTDALDEKYASTMPPRGRERKIARPHVRAYLRTVRPDDNVAADRALTARDGAR